MTSRVYQPLSICPVCDCIIVNDRPARPHIYCSNTCRGRGQSNNITLEFLLAKSMWHPETGCLEWNGTRDKNGYGVVREKKQTYYVHRKAYALYHGVTITPQQFILHICDNPPCLRQEHLRIGTALDNNRDCIQKGRGRFAHGERHYKAKLTDAAVRLILANKRTGMAAILAKAFRIHPEHIRQVWKRHIWKHVTLLP